MYLYFNWLCDFDIRLCVCVDGLQCLVAPPGDIWTEEQVDILAQSLIFIFSTSYAIERHGILFGIDCFDLNHEERAI